MSRDFPAVITQGGEWWIGWIGWIGKARGVNAQARTREQLPARVKATPEEEREFSRPGARASLSPT